MFDGKDELPNQGTGFKEGDRVTVLIKNGVIEWHVSSENKKEDKEVTKLKSNALREANKTWVPFIVLFSPADEVIIVEDHSSK